MPDDKDSVTSVGGSDGTSWNKHRLDFVSVTFKVVADALQGKGLAESVSRNSVDLVEKTSLTLHWRYLALLDHREDASNILSNDPRGLYLINAAEHVRPEVAVIFRASSLPGITERLTRESSREDVDSPLPFAEIGLCDVFIAFRIWVPIVQYGLPEGVDLAVEDVLPPEHRGGYLGASDAAEDRGVRESHLSIPFLIPSSQASTSALSCDA